MESISIAEARTRWADVLQGQQRKIEIVPVTAALGRVLAAPVTAQTAMPPFRKSPYDGYAIPYEPNRQDFTVIGTIGAGEVFSGPVAPGEAVRIMTGAPLPDDCDTVIMQERCDRDGTALHVNGAIKEGDNVIPIGEECQAGELIADAGVILDAGRLAVAVGLGAESISVYKPLKGLLLTSGREITEPGYALEPGKIYNSNRFMIQGLLAEMNITDVQWHHVSDDPQRLTAEIETVKRLTRDVDFIISTGGVAVGLYDTMPDIFEALGAKRIYNRLQMRPGAASYGGFIAERGVPCFGLSGNPSAAYNTFQLLTAPALRQLQGLTETLPVVVPVKLGAAIHHRNPFDRYVQGVIEQHNGEIRFMPNRLFTSSALLGLAHVNGLAMLSQGHHEYNEGDVVPVTLLKTWQ